MVIPDSQSKFGSVPLYALILTYLISVTSVASISIVIGLFDKTMNEKIEWNLCPVLWLLVMLIARFCIRPSTAIDERNSTNSFLFTNIASTLIVIPATCYLMSERMLIAGMGLFLFLGVRQPSTFICSRLRGHRHLDDLSDWLYTIPWLILFSFLMINWNLKGIVDHTIVFGLSFMVCASVVMGVRAHISMRWCHYHDLTIISLIVSLIVTPQFPIDIHHYSFFIGPSSDFLMETY